MNPEFLLIESRDPIGTSGSAGASALALGLAAAGRQVAVFLIQNGVVPARRGARWPEGAALAEAGVTIHADSFSLRERGITNLDDAVEAAELDPILDALGSGARVLFY